MSKLNFLLFINNTPENDSLKKYFAQFNIDIIQQRTINPVYHDSRLPLAILIEWSLINNDLQMIKHLYTTYPIPLIVINECLDEELCIQVLDAGADDYIVQPIYARELHARISAITRRVSRLATNSDKDKEVFAFQQWRLHPASRRVFCENNNNELILSAGEYDLLYTFVQQPQQILDREFLLQITKNRYLNPFDRRIDVQISRLRQKIEKDAKNPVLIKTIRNGGYMFATEVMLLKM